MLVTLQYLDSQNVKPFRFLNMRISHPLFHATVREAWLMPAYGKKQFFLSLKLKNLKGSLKTLNNKVFLLHF